MKPDEARRRIAKKAQAYANIFAGTDGQLVLDDLNHLFGMTTLKRDREGRIDPNASIAAAGCREVLMHIEQMRNYNATTE